jgi:hypothetical protein
MEAMTTDNDRGYQRMVTLATATLMSVWVVMAILAVTIWYPWNPVTKLRIRVVGEPVVGRSMTVEVDYCKAREWVPDEVRFSLLNEVTISIPFSAISLPTGCHVTNVVVPLPQHIVPTRYRVQLETIYRPWPWVEIPIIRQSRIFQMLATPETAP